MRIAMVGTGYVGLVTGTCLAEIGHDVVCVDIDKDKVKRLKDGVSPIYEPGLSAMMRHNMEQKRLEFTTSLAEALQTASCAFIAVGTPEGADGGADLRFVFDVASQIGEKAFGDLMVVTKSTVPVGTGDKVHQLIQDALKRRKVDHSITVTSNPEFLKEGDAIKDFMRPDRIVVGVSSEKEVDLFRKIYRTFVLDDPNKLLVMDRRSAELTKYGSNAMLATRISFMNELSRLCERVGADIDAIRRGMGADPRIGRKFLYAGPGYGGSCFPKDVEALLKTGNDLGISFSVLQAVSKVNEEQKIHVAKKIKNHFKDGHGVRIALWGLAFKPGTDDVREAPSGTIIHELLQWGASVCAHDPQAIDSFSAGFGDHAQLTYETDHYQCLKGADALVLVTEWSEYRQPDWTKVAASLKNKVVFDLRNQYEPQVLMEAGFYYVGVGRPDSTTLT